ncbi:MAG: fumarate hydratase [Deltaproteobacteria bacterium]|nr:fumarate hydratase [Deltaproteobacteria bacterium]
MNVFQNSLLQLIVDTSTTLPADVTAALASAFALENSCFQGQQALNIIADNIEISAQQRQPICQDTGQLTFYISCPTDFNQLNLENDIRHAVAQATQMGVLRPNSVNSLNGKNSGNNLGKGNPIIHFTQWENDYVTIGIILKGGGCENRSKQYSLPCELPQLGLAGRDIKGVKACILQAIWEAQGLGCPSGFIGVAIGADRASGYDHAKKQLFRAIDDINPDPDLVALEKEIISEANNINIGVMGFGGQATLLSCKIAAYDRIPASFFVSIAYNCWALRRYVVNLNAKSGEIIRTPDFKTKNSQRLSRPRSLTNSNVIKLKTPLNEDAIHQLRVGDVVQLSGRILTARDAAHKYLINHDPIFDLNNQIIYHCGPVLVKDNNDWRVVAAGPTTSMREEPYQAKLIEKFKLRAIIGKGGLGQQTQQALQAHGAVYLHAVGGAAQIYASCIRRVNCVYYLDEFGMPEAIWDFECKDMPLIVTMDSHGQSWHQQIKDSTSQQLAKLFL